MKKGQGPLVILGHGFPCLCYARRSQIRNSAKADAYDHAHSIGDQMGLMKLVGETSAVIVARASPARLSVSRQELGG
jgi:hypothetical protein